MFHRHKKTAAVPVAAATTGTVLPATGTGLVAPVATGFAAPLVTGFASPAIIPVAPAPPGPILAVPMVPLQQVQQPLQEASGAGLLNKVKEVLPSPSTISNAVKKTAETVLPSSSDTTAKTEATLQPVNPPVSMAPVAPALPAQFTTLPVNFLKEERPAVVKERIIPIEEETIQPVIHREVERREIHEVLQPIHERQYMPATIEEKELQAEYRPVIGGYAPRQASLVAPSVEYATTERTQIVRPPIIEETIRKTIIEEVQPVIHREVVKPHIIRQTQPIYEKIVEPEVILKETRPMIEQSSASEFSTFQAAKPAMLPATTDYGNKYVFEVDQKTKLKPLGTTNYEGTTSGMQTGYSSGVYRGYPGAK